MGPLKGLRVIDMTSVVMGPYTTQFLGDFGADVIKVEAPAGDVVRQVGPSRNPGMGPLFLNSNRSKRSITLNLKQAEAKETLLKLCEDADILVYSIRPAAMERLGLSYEAIQERNDKLIYAGIFGYSQKGPYAAKPAYDDLIQGAALLPYLSHIAGSEGPRYVPNAISDRVVGLFALSAILAALYEKQNSGKGQRIDIPMFECMVSFVLADHLGGLSFEPALDQGGYPRQLSPQRKPYKTKDGYVCTLIYTDSHWQRFFAAIGKADFMQQDVRFSSFTSRMDHIDEVYGFLSDLLLERTTDEWLEIFNQADVPAMPMYDFDGVLHDPHLENINFFKLHKHPTEGLLREMSVPTQFYRTPATPEKPAPSQGQHGREILLEAGLNEDQIEDLAKSGAWIKPIENLFIE